MRARTPGPFASTPESKTITPESLAAFYERLGDRFNDYHRNWRDRFLVAHQNTTEIVGGAVAGELGVTFNIRHPLLWDTIVERVNMIVGENWPAPGTIPGRTFDAIMNTLTEGVENGDGIPQLQQRVRNVFDRGLHWTDAEGNQHGILNARQRSRLIARTESAWMSNGAAVRQVQTTGLPYDKVWLTQGDDRVRPDHVDMEGEKVPVEEAFSNGLEWPGEPNCRCGTLFELREAA